MIAPIEQIARDAELLPCRFCGGIACCTIMPKPTIDNPSFVWCGCGARMEDIDLAEAKQKWNRQACGQQPAAPEKLAPVQGYKAGIPWSMHLRAYDAYCKQYGTQHALIDLEGRNCRGGFCTKELDDFIPGWREELSEMNKLKAEIERLKNTDASTPPVQQPPEWACAKCGYHNNGVVCTKCGGQPTPTGWRGISSAPKIDCKNGCVLILGNRDGDPIVVYWWENYNGWFSFETSKKIDNITHWMPLPATPHPVRGGEQ